MIRARVFLVMVGATLTALIAVLAISNVHAYEVADRRADETGHLADQVSALQRQLRQNDLVPVVPETTTTTTAPRTAPAARGASARPGVTTTTAPPSTTSTTTTAPQRPPSTICALVVCTKGAS